MIFIREMTADDWPAVSEIFSAGIEAGSATFLTECPSYEAWDAGHLQNLRYVAEWDGWAAGFIAVLPISTKPAYAGVVELSVYVAPHAKRHGIGRALVMRLIEESERAGVWTLQAVIIRNNTASVRLHESCGFRLVGWREKPAMDKFGVWRDTVIMERRSQLI